MKIQRIGVDKLTILVGKNVPLPNNSMLMSFGGGGEEILGGGYAKKHGCQSINLFFLILTREYGEVSLLLDKKLDNRNLENYLRFKELDQHKLIYDWVNNSYF